METEKEEVIVKDKGLDIKTDKTSFKPIEKAPASISMFAGVFYR